MTRHYVYVDSRNRNPEEHVNDFTVNLHNPIKNVVRAGLVSFSKGNNSWNVHEGNNVIRWREIRFLSGQYQSANDVPYFQFTIATGYWGINELLTEITNRMSSHPNRQFSTETATTYTYNIDDDYRVSIQATAAGSPQSNRFWAFYSSSEEFNNSILHSVLNFKKDNVVTNTNLARLVLPPEPCWRQSGSDKTVYARTIKAGFSYTENQSVLHLASNIICENSQSMVFKDGHSQTVKTNILETIQVVVNRWSYIHINKNSNDVQFHDMHNKTLTYFDVKLLGEHGEKSHSDAQSDFKCVFVFESIDEPRTEINEMYKEYNASAYKQAHRVR